MDTNIYTLEIKEKIQETKDTISLVFDITGKEAIFQYEAGQYLTLIFQEGDKEYRRAYSMSAAPSENKLKITVKRVAKGLYSNYLADKVKVGDTLMVLAPMGRFVINDINGKEDYTLIGGGSGITPLIAIAKTVLVKNDTSKVSLYYGNQDEASIIFKKELDALQEKYPNRLSVMHIIENPVWIKKSGFGGLIGQKTTNWTGAIGLPSIPSLQKFWEGLPSPNNSLFYICGPTPLMDLAENFLRSKSVDSNNVFLERFSSGTSSSTTVASTAGMVTITLKKETFELHIPEGKKILDAVLEYGKTPPFSCMTGACSSCMARLMAGEVAMDFSFGLSESDKEKGYILTCQAVPTSEGVVIDYDNI